MGADSKIEWTHHTFNPWRGCTHVSPGCEHCYAEALAKRNPSTLGTWGAGGTRVVAAEAYWRQPLRWDAAASAAGERHRVFCASLADVFEDRPELDQPRARLFALISATPHLDWLLLTKRPAVAHAMLTDRGDGSLLFAMDDVRGGGAGDFAWPLQNLWLGTSVEDQRRADSRVPILLECPAAVHFLSCEPLLGPVELAAWLPHVVMRRSEAERLTAEEHAAIRLVATAASRKAWPDLPRIDWLIAGGESGPGARPMDLAWARSLVEQGRAAGVPVFVKQLGARPYVSPRHDGSTGYELGIRDRAGRDIGEWPEDLRVREFPAVPS